MSKEKMGSCIDDFLRDEGIFEEAQAQAVKEVVEWQHAEAMKSRKISKNDDEQSTRVAEDQQKPGRPPF